MEVKLKSELSVRKFELPLPTVLRPHSHSSSNDYSEVEQTSLPRDFASEAGIFHGSKLSVSWKILDSRSWVELAPLDLDGNRFPGKGNRVQIQSPIPIHPYCTSLSEADGNFVLDFLTLGGSLFTVLVPIDWLLDPSATADHSLFPENNVFQPNTFDLIKPKILKAVKPSLLIISLEDGSLVRLDRTSPLSTPKPAELRVQKASFSLGGLFFSSTDRIPGQPSLSPDCAVSLEIVDDNTLVTCSIDNTVRVWSLLNNTIVQEIKYDTDRHYRMRPSDYIAVNGLDVVVALPHELRLYQLDPNAQNLIVKQPSLEIQSELRNWFLTSLCILESGKLIVAFKLNFSAKIFIIHDGKWEQIGGHDFSQALDMPADVSVNAIQSHLLERSPVIVEFAIKQVAPNMLHKLKATGDGEASPRYALAELFANMSQENHHTELLRIETLCREIEVQVSEILAVAPAMATKSGMFFWSLRVSGASLLSVHVSGEQGDIERSGSRAKLVIAAENLLGQVPQNVFAQISAELLSSDLILERVDKVCTLLRPHLDQLRLNELGRSETNVIASELREYIKTYGALSADIESEPINVADVALSSQGLSAVSSLVSDYSTDQALQFQLLSALAVIALVEGWFSNANDENLLKDTVACLRKFTILGELGNEKLSLDSTSVPLELFGIKLARMLIMKIDLSKVLCQILPPNVKTKFTREDYAEIDRVLSYCEINAELLLLKAFAALASGYESTGVALAQQVSLSRPWPKSFGERPKNQSAWFLELARYSQIVGAQQGAFELAQYAESLANFHDAHSNDLHQFLFKLSVEAGDISSAYTALTRRFRENSAEDETTAEEWIKELIIAAARKSEEEARNLLTSYPFVGLSNALQNTLSNSHSFAAVPAYKIKYAWHVEREDYAGAAQVIYDYIHTRKNIEPVRKEELYTVCLNALTIDNKDAQWLFSDGRAVSCQEIDAEHKGLLDEMAQQI